MGTLQVSKQNLLAKSDWLGLSAARSVLVKFPSAAEISKVGRHKKRRLGATHVQNILPDYRLQFTQPALCKRKRETKTATELSPMQKTLSTATLSQSNPSQFFLSSPPFSVMTPVEQDDSKQDTTTAQYEFTLYDPDRTSYVLDSSSDNSLETAPALMSLEKARDFRNFEEVWNEQHKNDATNLSKIYDENTDVGRRTGSSSNLPSAPASNVMALMGLSSLPSEPDAADSQHTHKKGTIFSEDPWNSGEVNISARNVSTRDEAALLQGALSGARKRALSIPQHPQPAKRSRKTLFSDNISATFLAQEGVRSRDFASTFSKLLRTTTSPLYERDVPVTQGGSVSNSSLSGQNVLCSRLSNVSSSDLLPQPRQFSLDPEFEMLETTQSDPCPAPATKHLPRRDLLGSMCDITNAPLVFPSSIVGDSMTDTTENHLNSISQFDSLPLGSTKRFSLEMEDDNHPTMSRE